MTSKTKLLPLLGVALAALAGPAAFAAPILNAKAAELALHRIERLVILKKIDEAYQSRFRGLSVTPLPHQLATDAAFEVRAMQVPAGDGPGPALGIQEDETGKAISHVVVAGGEPTGAPVWPDKDPVTLAENSLHYILDNSATETELLPFFNGLTDLTLSQGTGAAGAPVANVEIHAGPADPTLEITILADGTFGSYWLVPRAR